MMTKLTGFFLIFILIVAACTPVSSGPAISLPPTTAPTSSTTPTQPATLTPSPTHASSPTSSPTETLTPTQTLTSAPTSIKIQAGSQVTVPVFVYHHIATHDTDIRYFVTPDDFQTQMDTLNHLGYTTISVSKLISVIKDGGEMPARPMVITFDDGNEDVYLNAFPIMKSLGMTATNYIITNRLGLPDFLSVDELKEMSAAGWEVGCHSNSHVDLKISANLGLEMYNSRLKLADALGFPIQTFAYPFGSADAFIMKKTKTYGYEAGMGLGTGFTHSKDDLFYISRMEIRHSTTLDMFIKMLPWKTP
jgi:peptidoglycan/xylan/chitin deacetylase (PgdA/CDA1 family)